jgi:endonuclease/exonuclease/phosphatase family metal-dependent hydrolase
VALLYSKKYFRPSSFKNIPLIIRDTIAQKEKKSGKKKKPKGEFLTRDQLLVTGHLASEEVHFIVNHWPSRYGGEKKSRPNRLAAAALNKSIVDSLYRKNPQAKIINMGDFNDGPYNESVAIALGAEGNEEDMKAGGLFNPMARLWKLGGGTTTFKDKWELFDQIIVSQPLLGKDYTSLRFYRMNIFSRDYMITPSGKYKAYPLRNSNGEAGYSDHLPVYITLVKEVE